MVDVRVALGVALATAALLLTWTLLAAPAFADAKAHSGTLQYVNCDRVQAAAIRQYNSGNSGDVHQDLKITQDQTCPGSGNKNTGTKDDGVLADTIVKGTLPNTGGLYLPALAAYALIVTGAFSLVCRIRRRR